MLLAQIRSAEFFAPPTAAKRGRKFCRKTKTLAASTLFSIRIIRTLCSHHFGRRVDSLGSFPAADRAADFIGRKTTGSHGSVWKETDFRAVSSAKSASLFPERIR